MYVCTIFRFYFNSIKVQLEQVGFRLKKPLPGFQFHKGTIRTVCFNATAYPVVNFNSIKVQLELGVIAVLMYVVLFQFHKGTIRTFYTAYNLVFNEDFNSIKVQLEQYLEV